ncbi:MAG: S8 family serine peptidase [Streptosporangiales bacterium]|nr:S8 family serine peptidase [Streptosporangiales bacterium]
MAGRALFAFGWLPRRVLGIGLAAALAVPAVVVSATPSEAAALPARQLPAKPWRAGQWYLDTLQVAKAWQVTKGQGVTVAVIDSGVLAEHPALLGRVLPGADLNEGEYWTTDDPGTRDGQGHGTAIASLIAGNGAGGFYGVAPQSAVLPLQISTSFFGAGGSPPDPTAAARGVVYAVDHGAKVINLAFGEVGGEYLHLEEAIAYAQRKGVVVVAAAGNEGKSQIINPAAYPGVISVGAVGRDRSRTRESNYGKRLAVTAPGEDLLMAAIRNVGALGQGAAGGFGTSHGTSYATGFVSGVVALVRSRYPKMSAEEVVNRVVRSATDLGPQGRDAEYGFGLINAATAVTGNVPEAATNPLGSMAPPPVQEDEEPGTAAMGAAVVAGSGLLALVGPVLVGLGVWWLVRVGRRRSERGLLTGPIHSR